MKNNDVKKVMRKINKDIRFLNKQIETDDLWRGRFYAHPIRFDYERYDDRSGVAFLYYIVFIDKKTNKNALYKIRIGTPTKFYNHLGWAMNGFIMDYIQAWTENPSPYDDIKDYTKVKKLDKHFKINDFNFNNIIR